MSMQGKTVLVTGATNGIGKFTALGLAKMGARVIVHGRSAEKLDTTQKAIREVSGNDEIYTLRADLSLMADVRRMADSFCASFDRLDVLVNNAGAYIQEFKLTPDGYEQTFALNHLSYFLLTHLLLDMLKDAPSARVINVASDAHRIGALKTDNLGKNGSGFGMYGQSKLMNVMFTYALARRLEGTRVTSNAMHPGFVATGFGKNNNPIIAAAMMLMRPIQKTPEQGADTVVYLASSPEVEGQTAQYWVNRRSVRSSKESYDEQMQEYLWSFSERSVGLTAPVNAMASR